MFSSFSKLNTTKVLDFLAWYEARKIYLDFLDTRDSNTPLRENSDYALVLDRIIEIKSSMNRSRVNFSLPLGHEWIISDEWLLGFTPFFI